MTAERARHWIARMSLHAERMRAISANPNFPWGLRYEAAVVGEEAVELLVRYQLLLQKTS